MGEDPEKRFHSIMDKLFYAPNHSSSSSSGVLQISSGKKRANPEAALALVEPSKTRTGPLDISSTEAPLCRPWDRGDLMRRLATFKSMTWFAKPKVASAVNCAKHGWINLDMDIIACEACGARLLFSTPSSWSQQQVEKAALVFSLKLNSGHKLLCPWIDNACDERLAEFPPTPPQVLVDKFRERSCSLLQLLALPLISSSAIEYMRSPQLEEFLGQSPTLQSGNGSANVMQIQVLGNDCEADSANLYYQAQKLVGLCGWEPRTLPYTVDSKDRPKQPVKDANVRNLSYTTADGQNPNIHIHSVATEESTKVDEESGSCPGPHADPNATVLDCKLCGANVGLWTFSMVPRPLELLRLVGYTEVDTNKNSGKSSADENHVDNSGNIGHCVSKVALTCTHRPSNLSLTIAGGPPPTKQNFKATISLPVIGRNLRARFSFDSEFRDRTLDNLEVTMSGSENNHLFAGEKKCAEHNSVEQLCQDQAVGVIQSKSHDRGQCSYTSNNKSSCLNIDSSGCGALSKENYHQISLEGMDATEELTISETAGHDSSVECLTPSIHGSDAIDGLSENANSISRLDLTVDESNHLEMITSSNNRDGQQILGSGMSGSKNISNQMDLRGGETCSDLQNTPSVREKCKEVIKDRFQIPKNGEVVAYGTGKDPKQMALEKAVGFDPIRQHRHFCPWIASTSNGAPGWQQTLSALQHQREFSVPSTRSPVSSSLIKVDDPIASVRKLFMSPSAKRMKPTSESS